MKQSGLFWGIFVLGSCGRSYESHLLEFQKNEAKEEKDLNSISLPSFEGQKYK